MLILTQFLYVYVAAIHHLQQHLCLCEGFSAEACNRDIDLCYDMCLEQKRIQFLKINLICIDVQYIRPILDHVRLCLSWSVDWDMFIGLDD